MVIRSEFERKPRPRASWAEVATFAVAMVSKAFFIASSSFDRFASAVRTDGSGAVDGAQQHFLAAASAGE